MTIAAMKKIVIAIMLFAAAVQVSGQTYDTIYNRSDELYYSEWYDTSLVFLDTGDPCCLFIKSPYGNTSLRYLVISDYTPRPLKVRGLALMHTKDYTHRCNEWPVLCGDTSRVPEYVRLYQGVGDTLIELARARWDTATPQVLKLPRKQDTSRGFEYCYLYRIYFDTSITVDSVFFIGGSNYNNIYPLGAFYHRPTFYMGMGRQPKHSGPYWTWAKYHSRVYYVKEDEDGKESWFNETAVSLLLRGYYYNYYYGPFFAIAPDTSCVLELHSADSAMGRVEGGGWYLDSSNITIRAVPERGYRFAQWNDGDRSNPRTVFLTHDTVFTAYFEEAYYTLAATAEPVDAGMVTGVGTYRGGDTATLAASPNEGFAFARWHDGDTARVRQLEMTRDTAFTALFYSTQEIDGIATENGQFRLVPNPATEEVRCLTAGEEFDGGVLKVVDVAGREVLRRELPRQTQACTFRVADHPSGTYFVTLTTAKGTSTQKLVVEN